MIDKVYTALKTFKLPVAYIVRPAFGSNKAVISYHFFNSTHAYYGDGEGKDFTTSLQVDVFYTADIKDLTRQIITKLKELNIRFSYEDEYEDTLSGTRLYHKVLVFNYLESEVM